MNVAFAFDHLLERDPHLFLMEGVMGLFPDAQVYTCAHNPESVVGPVALRKIHSSFLSNMIKDLPALKRKFFLIPKAVEGIEVASDLDILVCFTRGLAHRIPVGSKTKKIVYWLDPVDYSEQASRLSRFFFGKHFQYWYRRSQGPSVEIFSSQDLRKRYFPGAKPQVLYPAVKSEDFRFVENNHRQTLLIHSDSENVLSINNLAQSWAGPVIVFGEGIENDSDRATFHPNVTIEEVGCDGIFASLLNHAKVFVNFEADQFPSLSIQSLLSGVPVCQKSSAITRECLYNSEQFRIQFFDGIDDIKEYLKTETLFSEDFDPSVARRWALAFNERRFKSHFQGHLNRI
jgi:hypothetical protein